MLRGAFRNDVPTPVIGSITLFPKPDGKWYQKDSNGLVTPIGALNNVIGSQRQFQERLDQQNTTSTNWTQYLTINVNNDTPTTVKHEVIANFAWGYASAASDFLARIVVDGVQQGDTFRSEPKDPGSDQRDYNTFFNEVSLAPGGHQIVVEFASGSAGTQASMYSGRIRSQRVE